MPTTPSLAAPALAFAGLLGLEWCAPSAHATEPGQRVGIAGAVQPATSGRRPGGATERIDIGSPIVFHHVISTDPNGRTHISFLDRSSLTVGPLSRLTIDRFVYQPAQGRGDVGLTATTGVFRYIGGALSKQGDVSVTTPVAVLGIRGGIVLVTVETDGSTTATMLFGERLTARVPNGGAVVARPGQTVVIRRGDIAPRPPGPADAERIRETLQRLDGTEPIHADGVDPDDMLSCETVDTDSGMTRTAGTLAPSDLLPGVAGLCDAVAPRRTVPGTMPLPETLPPQMPETLPPQMPSTLPSTLPSTMPSNATAPVPTTPAPPGLPTLPATIGPVDLDDADDDD